jgi:hypothetical protein
MVSVRVVDQAGNSATTSFAVKLTVPPIVLSITAKKSMAAWQNSSTAPQAIQITDAPELIDSVTLSGSAANSQLIPSPGILFSGSGATRYIVIAPAANQYGTTTVTVTASDGQQQATQQISVSIWPVRSN